MANKFTYKKSKKETLDVDLEELLLKNMQREFPADPIYRSGNLTAKNTTRTAFGTPETVRKIQLETRNELNILNVTSGSSRYVEYKIDKTYPTVNDEDLDSLIDDEWNYFITTDVAPENELVNGIFLISGELELNPVDFHYAYLSRGPSRITNRLAAGESLAAIVRTTFCVFYVENNIAKPIPNYQTLEVMLVERGLTYDAIREATVEQIQQFDMVLDGTFTGNPGKQPLTPLQEFRLRQMLDRTSEWNYRVRFDSGYRPKAPFLRDPGDYLKPERYQGRTGRSDLYKAEDPSDLLFDLAFQKQTYKEKLRAKFEGKMIIGLWPTGGNVFDQSYVDGRSKDISDGLTYQVRMMINGFWKQVISDEVFRLYATVNDYNISTLAHRKDSPYENFIEESPDGLDFISGPRGFINLLVQAGGILPLQGFSTVWNDFPHIVEADRLDINEYKEYLDNYSNSNDAFKLDYLVPYEPPGSIAYYPAARLLELQRQVTLQREVDSLRASILEYWPSLARKVGALHNNVKVLHTDYNAIYFNQLGQDNPLFRFITTDERIASRNAAPDVFGKTGRVTPQRAEQISYSLVSAKQSGNAGYDIRDASSNILSFLSKWPNVYTGSFGDLETANQIVNTSNWGRVWSRQPGAKMNAIENIVSEIYPDWQTVPAEAMYDITNTDKNELPIGAEGVRLDLLNNSNYVNGMIAFELAHTLQKLDLPNRVKQATAVITNLRDVIDDAVTFVLELDDLILRADSITEFRDIYTRMKTLSDSLESFSVDGISQYTKIEKDIKAVFKDHIERLHNGMIYYRKRIFEQVYWGIAPSPGISTSDLDRFYIRNLPGKFFTSQYVPYKPQ